MTNTETIQVYRDGNPAYPIVLSDSFGELRASLDILAPAGRKICVVSDSQVAALYLREVLDICGQAAGKAVSFVFPAGEQQKTLDTVRDLYEFLILQGFDRKDLLVALGGGVTGDLTGFAAATYLRGISFVQIPTTLLSQVDSSIGGKTGVDFDSYKNMVGAFYMPKLVYMNLSVLATLPDSQFASGMGEVIKHGCIRSRSYYQWIRENREKIRARELPELLKLVEGSCRIKKAVVEEDPTEKGLRALLNFGHTLGHAIEKEMHFSMSHGACVAAGSVAAAWISMSRGLLEKEELQQLEELFSDFGLPVRFDSLPASRILEAVKHDKKMDSGVIQFILLKEMGEAYIDRTVTFEEMEKALEYLAR